MMKKEKLPNLKGYRVQLRPPALWFDEGGRKLDRRDDDWTVVQASENCLVLVNRWGPIHVIGLKPDAIHQFDEAIGNRRGILQLNAQVFIQGEKYYVERLVGQKRDPHAPIERRACPRSKLGQAILIGILGALLVTAVREASSG